MKILVDKLPYNPEECPHHKFSLAKNPNTGKKEWIHACDKSRGGKSECRIGEPDFKCPFYAEFHARAEEVEIISGSDGSFRGTNVRSIPVTIVDNDGEEIDE